MEIENSCLTKQVNGVEFPVLPFDLEYIARRIQLLRYPISVWNSAADRLNQMIFTPVATHVVSAVNTFPFLGPRLGPRLDLFLEYLRPYVVYSMEDHAPHHYISKLATDGVMNEFGT
jgi:hypothetical protein